MAVPKRRLSKHRKRTRRAHHNIDAPGLNRCSNCGAAIPPHRVCHNCGHYGGKEIVEQKQD
jgi:large subunit ribosomal protein L32